MDNQPVGHHLKVRGIPLRSDNSPHRRLPAVISMATHHNSARPLTHPRTTNDSVVAACYPSNRFGLGVLAYVTKLPGPTAGPACERSVICAAQRDKWWYMGHVRSSRDSSRTAIMKQFLDE